MKEQDKKKMPVECQGIWGKIFGHNYVNVFEKNRIPPSSEILLQVKSIECGNQQLLNEFMEYLTEYKSTFKHTICKRCGHIMIVNCEGGPSVLDELNITSKELLDELNARNRNNFT